ncbi:MAG: Phosphate-import protein PhnD [Alphaproteobacteria bacterium MarineAlpha4_Bin2]|nr:MAG: Phosphate-import protein PhnD [Alphaproteobacteria bacterium MarineAlpha4_Bin2]
MLKNFLNGIVCAVFLLSMGLFQVNAADSDPDTLRVALLPDEDAATIIKQNQGLKNYLETELNKKVEIVVTTDYSSMIEAMRFGRLELGYFGPLSYTLAKSKAAIEPFAARQKKGSTTYHAVLIGNRSSGVSKIDDVKGKQVAFGDIASTSSHLIPKKMLLDGGLEAKKNYKENFLGAHDAVALAVQNGHAQAGGLSKPIFESLVERGIISLDKVVVLQVSKPYPQYPWALRSDLSPALKANIRNAFTSLKDKKVLKPFKAEGFGAVTDKHYDVIRDLSKALRLTK